MRSIAIINFKGGVGKTTFTWLLGRYLTSLHKKVILVDIDPQMSLTHVLFSHPHFNAVIDEWLELEKADVVYSLSELMYEYGRGSLKKVESSKLTIPLPNSMHFIPSTPEYYKHQFKIIDAQSKRTIDFIKVLFNTIEKKVPSTDYVLFDCPPSYTPLLHSTLNYSDVFLIPVNTDKFGHRTVEGLCNFLSLLNLKDKRQKPPVGCVFANRVTTTKGVNSGALCIDDFSEYMRIKKEVDISDLIFTQTWIPERAAISKSLKEFELNDEQINLVNPLWNEIESKCW